MEEHFFSCTCGDYNHLVRFELDPEYGEVYLTVRLNSYEPWWKRVWIAVKYVFGYPHAYGHYDVTILREEDFVRLHAILDRAQFALRQQRSKEV